MSEESRIGEGERGRVAEAADVLVRGVLSGELRDMRESLARLEATLSRRMETLSDAATTRLDRLEGELAPAVEGLRARIAEVDEARERTMVELDDRLTHAGTQLRDEVATLTARLAETRQENVELAERLDGAGHGVEELRRAVGEATRQRDSLGEETRRAARERLDMQDHLHRLDERLGQAEDEVGTRVEAMRVTLEQEIAGGDAGLLERLEEAAARIDELGARLTQQIETSKRLQGVLTNLAAIFSGQRETAPQAVGAGSAGTASAAVARAAGDHGAGELVERAPTSELEKALDRVFTLDS